MVKRLSAYNQFKIIDKETEWYGLEQTTEPVALDLPHDARLCPTGLTLPENCDQDAWEEVGKKLGSLSDGIQWAVGDWWCFGHHKYGDRAKVAAKKILPYEFVTLMNMGSTARKIAPSLRNEALSFTHHQSVAKFEPEKQEQWLTKAARRKWSVKKLREQIYKARDEDPSNLDNRPFWTDHFLRQVKEARHAANSIELDDDHLSELDEPNLEKLIEAVSPTSVKWITIRERLEQYRQERFTPQVKSETPIRKRVKLDLHVQQAAE